MIVFFKQNSNICIIWIYYKNRLRKNCNISLIISSLKVDKALFDNTKDKEAFLNNFFKHANLRKYIELVTNHKDSNTKSNWFTKPELSMLFKIIMIDCIYCWIHYVSKNPNFSDSCATTPLAWFLYVDSTYNEVFWCAGLHICEK